MKKLRPGERPPQFIIFSFDGAGSDEKWKRFMTAADESDAKFAGFLTGIYLLEDTNSDAYTGPGQKKGDSEVGFGGTKEDVVTRIRNLNNAYEAGHEIGTHYNGHFCSGPAAGKTWTSAQWRDELQQFTTFVTDTRSVNGWRGDEPTLKIRLTDIKGGRTPCLQGKFNTLVPAWQDFGFTYDSSMSQGLGIRWPQQSKGIWEFEVPYIYSPAFDSNVTAMDYNFGCTYFRGGCDKVSANGPDVSRKLRPKVRKTYDYMYREAFDGSRAPVLIANHFNNWNGDSYNQATLDFMKATCDQPETYCATYQQVIAWLEMQDPQVLADLQDQPAVADNKR